MGNNLELMSFEEPKGNKLYLDLFQNTAIEIETFLRRFKIEGSNMQDSLRAGKAEEFLHYVNGCIRCIKYFK